MLSRRGRVAFAVALVLCATRATAEIPVADPSNGSGAGDVTPYARIYQAPLFGALLSAEHEAPVDESALRYYASLHNVARVNAEIRRLKALHPNWTAPTDIYSTAGAGADEQPFWDLLGAGRLEELRAALALKRKREPGWQPSRDLTLKIARKEAFDSLVAASDALDWDGTLRIADSEPSLLHCAYMDADWRVAEAFLKTGLKKRAYEIYRAVLTSCSDHEERLATVRKAIARFSVEEVKSLIAMGAKYADGASEFDTARLDLTRARIAAVNEGAGSDDIEAPELAEFLAEVARSHERTDLGLVGWYHYGHAHYGEAQAAFGAVMTNVAPGGAADDVKFAEGYALSLWKGGKVEEALRIAFAWREASETMRNVYIGAAVQALTHTPPPNPSQETLIDFAGLVESARFVAGAEALGWFRANRREWDEAASWFKIALAWRTIHAAPPGTSLPRPTGSVAKTIEGYATAIANTGRADEALAIADTWRNADPSLQALFVTLAIGAVDAAHDWDAVAPERLGHFLDAVTTEQAAPGARALGWLAYRSNRFAEAADWFRRAASWSPDALSDAKLGEGFALALSRAGRLAEAEDVAWTWRRQSAEMRAIYINIVADELARDDLASSVSEARLARFIQTVRSDRSPIGAKALGWRRLQQSGCVYATPWFRDAVRWSADSDEDSKLAEGLALSLTAAGQYAQAEEIAYRWRERSSDLRALYRRIGAQALTQDLPPVPVNEARMARFATIVLEDRDPLGAQALGWRRYRQAGSGYAVNWFRLATEWAPDARRDAKTDEGYALALRNIGRLQPAADLARPWADRVGAMKKLYLDVMVEQLSRDNPPEPIDERRLDAFADMVEPMRSALGAQALGWYRLERGEFGDAVRWFKNAVDWWPAERKNSTQRLSAPAEDYVAALAHLALSPEDYRRTPRAFPNSSSLIGKSTQLYVESAEGLAKTYEGYALTLRSLGRSEEAETIAFAWRERWPALRKLFLDMAVSEVARREGEAPSDGRLRRYLTAIREDRDANGAAAMGWRLYGRGSFEDALEWFRLASEWGSQAQPDFRVLEGRVLALRGAKRLDEALALASRWRETAPRFKILYLETRLQSLRERGDIGKTSLATLAEIEAEVAEARSADAALSLAWIAYDRSEYPRALTWFKQSLAWDPEQRDAPKAIEGTALTLHALGKVEELAALAKLYGDRVAPARALYSSAMAQWLTQETPQVDLASSLARDFESAANEGHDAAGAGALGWAHLQRKDYAPALGWFHSALDWSAINPTSPPADRLDASRAKLIEGYIASLRGLGRIEDAEAVAFSWRGRTEGAGALYLQIVVEAISANAELDAARLTRFAEVAAQERSPLVATAFGWRLQGRGAFSDALDWFGKARAWSPGGEGDAKANEGYALALRGLGRAAEAEAFAYARRDQSKELRAVYAAAVADQLLNPELAAQISAARLERFADIVRIDRNATGAEALGWRRLQDAHCGYAVGWFRKAGAWAKNAPAAAKAAAGLAQALRTVGEYNEAEDVAFAGAERARDLRALYVSVVVEELTRQWPRPRMSEFRLQRFALVASADHSSVAAQALGWRRYAEAGCGYGGQWFRLAAAWAPDGRGDAKLNEGFALSLRAIGRLSEAEQIAYPWIEKQPAMKKLYIDIAVEELSRDNPPEPMAETRLALFEATIDPIRSALGAQALGWYHFARHEPEASAKWFKTALDWWPANHGDSNQKLSAPVDDYKPRLAQLAMRPEDYRRTPRAYPNSSLLIGRGTESYVDTALGLAKTVEGYVLSLTALGRYPEAEDLAFAWRDRWPRLRALYIDAAAAELAAGDAAALTPDRLERIAGVINGDRSPRGASALAWRAYAGDHFDEASHWFQSALAWRAPETGPPDAASVEAYAQALRKAGRADDALALLGAWRAKLPALADAYFATAIEDLRAHAATPDASTRLAALAADVVKSRAFAAATSLGWMAYDRKEFPAALAWFRQAIVWTPDAPDAKALEGYARALIASQRIPDALTFASEWSERAETLKPLFVDIAAAALGEAATSGDELPMPLLTKASAAIAAAKSAPGASALAWQRLAAKDWVAAAAWFQAARGWGSTGAEDDKNAEGLVMALRNLHREDEAVEIAYAGATREGALRDLYIETLAERLTRNPPSPPNADGLNRFVAVVTSAHSANGAQALGWFSYKQKQWPAAIAWFTQSLGWEPVENAAVGLAMAYRAAGDRDNYERVVSTYRAQYSRVAEIGNGAAPRAQDRRAALEVGDDPAPRSNANAGPERRPGGGTIAAALSAKDYSTCVARADAAARDGALNASQQLALGWCLLNLERRQEAARAFEAAMKSGAGKTRDDAAYGRSLALLASGQAVEAGAMAAQAHLTDKQRNDVGVEILASRAWDAWHGQRYRETLVWLDRRAAFAAETRDLMQLRAWALAKTGQTDAARSIESQLDAQLGQ